MLVKRPAQGNKPVQPLMHVKRNNETDSLFPEVLPVPDIFHNRYVIAKIQYPSAPDQTLNGSGSDLKGNLVFTVNSGTCCVVIGIPLLIQNKK